MAHRRRHVRIEGHRASGRWGRLAVGAAGLLLALPLMSPPASASASTTAASVPAAVGPAAAAAPLVGNATFFDGLGAPYGGCGLPQPDLETQDFVALNVYNTPRDYTFYPRPLVGANVGKIGQWDNGHNCGRWVQVTIGDYCTGVNDGAPGQAFCRNGSYIDDGFRGGVLNMLVADSCGDSNAWCRDDPFHLDLSKPSLNRFVRGGAPVTNLFPDHWNNRHVEWTFVPAPHYTGDIQIGFLQGAQVFWPAISVSRLPNGIHGVEYLANGVWQQATMNSDMGQSFIIGATTAAGSQFQIRVRDAADALVNGGRTYSFALPAACGSSCGAAYTKVPYTTAAPGEPPSTPPPSTPPSNPPSTPPGTPPAGGGACAATTTIDSSWQGGFQATVTVTAGATAITGWNASWTTPAGTSLNQVWNGTSTVNGSTITVRNASYNGGLAAGASTTFGFTANGPAAAPIVTCSAA